MKKVASILLIILFLFASVTSVYATNETTVKASKQELNLGEEFTVTITFNSEKSSVYTYTAKLSYDRDVFDVIDKEDFGEQENFSDITYNSSNNKFALVNQEGDNASKTLNIKFKVKENATPGETTITVNSASASDEKGRTKLESASTKVTVIKNGLSEGESLPVNKETKVDEEEEISLDVKSEKGFPWKITICIVICLVIAFAITRILFLGSMNKNSKIIITVIGIILIILLLIFAFTGSNKENADINNDGTVNHVDTKDLIEYVLEIKKPMGDLSKFDVNKDGKVDATDIAGTVQKSKNKDEQNSNNTTNNNLATGNSGNSGNSGGQSGNGGTAGGGSQGGNPGEQGGTPGGSGQGGNPTPSEPEIKSEFVASQSSIKQYVQKGEYVEATFVVNDNTDKNITHILVNGVKLPVEKVNDGTYKVKFNCPTERTNDGKFIVKATKIYYEGKQEGIDATCELVTEILKSELTVESLVVDDTECLAGGKPKLTFSIMDAEDTYISGTIIIVKENGETSRIELVKDKNGNIVQSYELDNIEQLTKYNVSIEIKYDLDSDKSSVQNQNTKTFVSHEFSILKDYELKLDGVKFNEPKDGKIVLEFSSTNASNNDIESVLVGLNGTKHEYKVSKGADGKYTVEIPLQDLNNERTELTLEELILSNLKGFNKENSGDLFSNLNSLVAYKDKPTATVGSVSINNEKTNITVKDIEFTDKDKTLGKKYAVLKQNGEIVQKIEITDENKDIIFNAPENENFKAGTYEVEIIADYNINDGETYAEQVISKTEKITIDVVAEVASLVGPKYAKKAENIVLTFTVKSNALEDIKEVYVNGLKAESIVKNADGSYNATVLANSTVGTEEFEITKLVYNGKEITIENSQVANVYILKDKLSIADFKVNIDGAKPVVTFNMTDSDNSFVSGDLVLTNPNTKEEKKISINKDLNTYTLEDVEEYIKYNLELKITYDLDDDNSNGENQAEEVFASSVLEFIKEYNLSVTDLVVKNIDRAGYIVNLEFKSTNVSSYKVAKVVIGDREIAVSKVEGTEDTYTFEYILEENELDVRKELTIDNVVLENTAKPTLNTKPVALIFKMPPTITDLAVNKTDNVKINVKYNIKDDDKALSNLYVVLKDEQNNVVTEKMVDANTQEVSFDIAEAKKYKVEILGDFDLVDGLVHSREELIKDENLVEIAPNGQITTTNISNKYPSKGETIEVSYNIISNVVSTPTKVLLNETTEQDLIVTGTPNEYKIQFKVEDYATLETIRITKVYFENGQILELTEPHEDKVEVLKNAPTVNVTSSDYVEQNRVLFNITVTDPDSAMTSGKATVHDKVLELKSGSNTFDVEVKPDEEHILVVEVDYDLDNDELTEGTEQDDNTDRIVVNKNFTLVSDYKLAISDLQAFKTQTNEKAEIFGKAEQIQLKFNSTNSTTYEPESVTIDDLVDSEFDGTEYPVKKIDDEDSQYKYYVDLTTRLDAGLQEFKIVAVKLNSSKVVTKFENNTSTAKIEVLKDKPIMTNYTSTNHENSIIVKFDITDNDSALLDSKVKVLDAETELEVQSSKIIVGANTHTFKDLDTGKKYKIVVENNYSLRQDKTVDIQNEIVKEEEIEITDINQCDFRVKNLAISERVPADTKVHISFENGVMSYKDVDSVTIDGKKYSIEKGNDNIYKLDLEPGPKGVNIIKLESVSIGTKVFAVNRNLRYIHEKVVPEAINVTEIYEDTKNNLARITFDLKDPDVAIKSLKGYMKNSAGAVSATTEDIIDFDIKANNTLEMPLLKLDEYHIELRAICDIGDGETFEEKSLVTKDKVTIPRATVVEQTINKEYSNKEEEVIITVKLNTNVDQEVRKIYFGEDSYDVQKVKDEKGNIVPDTYNITIISPKETGIFEKKVTKVQIGTKFIDGDGVGYAEGVEPCSIKVLKDKPTLTHFAITDGNSLQDRALTFKLNDDENSLAKPEPVLTIKDVTNGGKEIATKKLTKGGTDYTISLKDLKMLTANNKYNITVNVNYDLKPTEVQKTNVFQKIANFFIALMANEPEDDTPIIETEGSEIVYDDEVLLTESLKYTLNFKDAMGFYYLTTIKDDDDSFLRFHCTTGTDYKVEKVIINDKEYPVTVFSNKDGDTVYNVPFRATDVNLTWITYQKVILENGAALDIAEKENISKVRVSVVQQDPTFTILEYTEDIKEKKVKFKFKIVDTDRKIASDLTFKLLDSQNGLLAEKILSKNETNVEFDIPNPPTSVYKLQVRGKLFEIPGYDEWLKPWDTYDGEFKSSVNTSILGSKLSTQYPKKGETITIDYSISSTTVIEIDPEDHTNQDKAVGISYLVINGKDYDVQTLGNGQYRIYYTAEDVSGIKELEVTAIKFTNGTTEEFIKKDKIDVLKSAPEIRNYKVENDLANNKVKFIFDLVDNDQVLVNNSISAKVNGQTKGIKIPSKQNENKEYVAHNEIEFDAEQNELSKIEIIASYDLDTDTLENETTGDDNSSINEVIFEKPFMLTGDYSIDIQNVKTYNVNGDEKQYFEKNEDILVKFQATTKEETLYPEIIVLQNKEYKLDKEDTTYSFLIKASDKAEKMSLPINSVILNSGNNVQIKDKNVTCEVLKDKLRVKEIKSAVSEDNGDNVNLDITIEDDDSSNNDIRLEIKDEFGATIETSIQKLNVGANRVSFEKTSAEKYFATVYADYDRDTNKTDENNHVENENIYYQIISINTRYIEMKDIVDIELYKFGDDGKAEKVRTLAEDNVQVLENCLVKVSMRNIAPFYSNITSYSIVDGKLRLILEYTDAMVYTGNEELKPLEVTLDIFEGSSAGYQYGGSFQALVDRMRANPEGKFDLDKDYDLDDYGADSTSKAIIDFEFRGTLNGNGHTIKNAHKPFFNNLKNATIENLVFKGTDFTTSGDTAAVVLYADNSKIFNVHVDLVTAHNGNGNASLAYQLKNGSIMDRCSAININIYSMYSNQNNAGAVVHLNDSTISNCYVEGKISSGWHINSGLVAQASGKAVISNNITRMTITPYFGHNGGSGNGGILSRGTAILKNNISLIDATNTIDAIYNVGQVTLAEGSKDNYQVAETKATKNTVDNNIIKEIESKNINKKFFTDLDFSDKVWTIADNASVTNLPVLKGVSASYSDEGAKPNNTAVYIPDYNRVSRLKDYDKSKEIVYHNMYKIMPFYDAKEIIRDGNKISADDDLSKKIIQYIIPYDKSGNMVSVLTTDNYNSLGKIRIVFNDKTSKEYHIDFDDCYGNVASYMISSLNIGYNYNKYVIDTHKDVIDDLVEIASSYTFNADLEPLTDFEDSRLYKEHFEKYTVNHIKDFVVNTLVNMDYPTNIDSEVLDNLIKQELVSTGKLKKLLFAYNYFTYFYNFDMDGINVADSIMFHANEMFDIRMTFENITNELLNGTNSQTNGTAGYYNNNLAKYTKITNLGLFLDYYVHTLTHYEDGNTWFIEHWKGGRYYTVNIGKEGVDYTLWDHLKKDGKVQNDFLPLMTVPENSTYAIASPTQAYFGSLRVYMTDPSNPDQIKAFEDKVAKWLEDVKWFYVFGYTYWGADVLNKYCDVNYDMRTTYTGQGNATVYNNPLTTSEPYHKYFIEAVNRWAGTSGGAYANGNEVFWVVIKMLDNFRVGTHETLHNQDSKIFLNGYGRRGGAEDYAAGFLQQYYRDGWVSPNIFDEELNKENKTQNFRRSSVETNEKLEAFYKKYFNVNDYLDWLEAKAFMELDYESQAKLAVQVSYPKMPADKQDEGDDVVGYTPLTADLTKDMKLTSIEALWDNRIMLRPGCKEFQQYSPGADTDSIFNIRWYQPHADNERPDGANFKFLAWQMAGERGYYDGLCAYYSQKYVGIKTGEGGDTTDLKALRYIMKDDDITFREYKLNRYKELSKHYDDKDTYINAEEIYKAYLEALKKDAASGNRSLGYSTAVKRKYFRQIQTETDDFQIDPFTKKVNAMSLELDDDLTNSIDNTITNTVTNTANNTVNNVENNTVSNTVNNSVNSSETNTTNTASTLDNTVSNNSAENNSIQNNIVDDNEVDNSSSNNTASSTNSDSKNTVKYENE